MNILGALWGCFARVCIEINIESPLVGTLQPDGHRYKVKYGSLRCLWSFCVYYGHLQEDCGGYKEKHKEKEATKEVNIENETNVENQNNGGNKVDCSKLKTTYSSFSALQNDVEEVINMEKIQMDPKDAEPSTVISLRIPISHKKRQRRVEYYKQ